MALSAGESSHAMTGMRFLLQQRKAGTSRDDGAGAGGVGGLKFHVARFDVPAIGPALEGVA